MIRIDDENTILEGDDDKVFAELACAMHIFREKYGEEDFEEVLRISKMGSG